LSIALTCLACACSGTAGTQTPGEGTGSQTQSGSQTGQTQTGQTQTGQTQDEPSYGGPVELSGVFNARHTGGLIASNGKRVRDYVLIRSGELSGLDDTGCSQVEALDTQSVVDLRAAQAASDTPDADCATAGPSYYQADLPKRTNPSPDVYVEILHDVEPKLAAIFGHLADHGLPGIIHCVIGRDRAGLTTALVLLSLGVPEDQVLTDFVVNQDASVTTETAWLQAVLDEINGAGGIVTYLESQGVTAAQISALQDMVLE